MTEMEEPIAGDVKSVGRALGLSFQVDIGDGMMIVFQTHMDHAQAMNGALNPLLDKIYDAGKRQRAKGEIRGLQNTIAQLRKQIEAGDARVEQAEANHKTKIEALQKSILDEQKKRESIDLTAREQFEARGRGGKYAATAQTNQRMATHDAQITKYRAEMINLNAQRDTALAAEAHARSVAVDEIEAAESQIREREALINPPG